MADRDRYKPGPVRGTRIVVREPRHPPERVWRALSGPAHLREWAPFDADGMLGTPARLRRLDDHLDGRATADMFKRFAGVRRLYG